MPKKTTKATDAPEVKEEASKGTPGDQQAARDKPHQQNLGAMLQEEGKIRAKRIQASEQRQIERRHETEKQHRANQ